MLLDEGRESRRGSDARLKKLAEGGALGVIQIAANAEGDFALENVAKPGEEPPPIPVIVAAARDRETLRAAAERGDATTLVITGEWQPEAKARNVIATLDRGPRRIVISTPYSGWFRCGGERGSGLAVFLALAQWAAKTDAQTSFTFVANSAHELGYAGMLAFLESAAPPPGEVVAWLHLGANVALLPEARPAGGERRSRLFVSEPRWQSSLAEIVKNLPSVVVATKPTPTGELRYVLPKGYPAMNLAGGGNRWMHAPGDGPETTGPTVLEPVARALCTALAAIQEAHR